MFCKMLKRVNCEDKMFEKMNIDSISPFACAHSLLHFKGIIKLISSFLLCDFASLHNTASTVQDCVLLRLDVMYKS